MKNLYIQSYCKVNNSTILLNGNCIYKSTVGSFPDFIKEASINLHTNYPRLFKMDNLSKLAFLAADILLNNNSEKNQNTAILLSNRAASLDTDRKHQESITDKEHYYPSPSVFVYTLPNISIGEISIKHQLFSENSFFIFERFTAEHLYIHANQLLKTNKANQVLCGWADFDNEAYEAFLYLVSENGSIKHCKEEINRLYKTL